MKGMKKMKLDLSVLTVVLVVVVLVLTIVLVYKQQEGFDAHPTTPPVAEMPKPVDPSPKNELLCEKPVMSHSTISDLIFSIDQCRKSTYMEQMKTNMAKAAATPVAEPVAVATPVAEPVAVV